METDSGQRAMSRRREGAKERRERRLRAEARIKLQLCRDAVRIASHRGGDGCRRAHTDASTQTATVDEPPVTKYVAPAFAASPVAPVPVPEHVASTVTLVAADPVIEDVAPAPTVSFNPVIEYVESAPGISYATPACEIDDLWLGRDQFDACAYDLAEIESILENFESAFMGKVLAEYIIHMCTKPMSCCLHDQVSRDSWLHPR